MADDNGQEALDWLNKLRLRIQLLPENPWFQERVGQIRQELGIAPEGYVDDEELQRWKYEQIREFMPSRLPSEEDIDGVTEAQWEEQMWLTAEGIFIKEISCPFFGGAPPIALVILIIHFQTIGPAFSGSKTCFHSIDHLISHLTLISSIIQLFSDISLL